MATPTARATLASVAPNTTAAAKQALTSVHDRDRAESTALPRLINTTKSTGYRAWIEATQHGGAASSTAAAVSTPAATGTRAVAVAQAEMQDATARWAGKASRSRRSCATSSSMSYRPRRPAAPCCQSTTPTFVDAGTRSASGHYARRNSPKSRACANPTGSPRAEDRVNAFFSGSFFYLSQQDAGIVG